MLSVNYSNVEMKIQGKIDADRIIKQKYPFKNREDTFIDIKFYIGADAYNMKQHE